MAHPEGFSADGQDAQSDVSNPPPFFAQEVGGLGHFNVRLCVTPRAIDAAGLSLQPAQLTNVQPETPWLSITEVAGNYLNLPPVRVTVVGEGEMADAAASLTPQSQVASSPTGLEYVAYARPESAGAIIDSSAVMKEKSGAGATSYEVFLGRMKFALLTAVRQALDEQGRLVDESKQAVDSVQDEIPVSINPGDLKTRRTEQIANLIKGILEGTAVSDLSSLDGDENPIVGDHADGRIRQRFHGQ